MRKGGGVKIQYALRVKRERRGEEKPAIVSSLDHVARVFVLLTPTEANIPSRVGFLPLLAQVSIQ